MDVSRFFLVQQARLHAVDVGDPGSTWDCMLGGLADDDMRRRPDVMNSLAWIVWHVARAEDVVVNLVVTSGLQVFDEAWAKRLGIARPDIGTGMTDGEVTDLSQWIDIPAAHAYRSAVGRRTRDVVAALPAAAWEDVVGQADIARAAAAARRSGSVARRPRSGALARGRGLGGQRRAAPAVGWYS